MRCQNCNTESDGRFCPNCGTPLGKLACEACGASVPPGSRFCTKCGKPVGGGPRGTAVPLSWVIAAVAVIILAVVLFMPRSSSGPALTPATFSDAPGNPALDPLSGSPRDQADRLFNRIMQESSAGNTDQAIFFTPMAIQAYGAAEPLDADGLYHLSLIHAVAGDFASSRAAAQRILDMMPTHLLGLAALAEAAIGEGDSATAAQAYGAFLDNLENERAKQLQEYLDHQPILATYEQDARAFSGS